MIIPIKKIILEGNSSIVNSVMNGVKVLLKPKPTIQKPTDLNHPLGINFDDEKVAPDHAKILASSFKKAFE